MRKITRKAAIESKCHECSGYYVDGKVDCQVPGCPLYQYMPYRSQEPDFSWLSRNPKRVGLVECPDESKVP
jgi:hypothetical protein